MSSPTAQDTVLQAVWPYLRRHTVLCEKGPELHYIFTRSLSRRWCFSMRMGLTRCICVPVFYDWVLVLMCILCAFAWKCVIVMLRGVWTVLSLFACTYTCKCVYAWCAMHVKKKEKKKELLHLHARGLWVFVRTTKTERERRSKRQEEKKRKRRKKGLSITSGHMEIIVMPAVAFLGNATVSGHIWEWLLLSSEAATWKPYWRAGIRMGKQAGLQDEIGVCVYVCVCACARRHKPQW